MDSYPTRQHDIVAPSVGNVVEVAVVTAASAAGGVALWRKQELFDGHSDFTTRGMWIAGLGVCVILVVLGAAAFITLAVG